MGITPAGPVLTFCILLGGLIAVWFWIAGQFITNNSINFSKTSFLPVHCSISSDNASDTKISSSVYLWQGNIRIDVRAVGDTTTVVHEVVTPDETGYTWQEGKAVGTRVTDVKTFPILNTTYRASSWFCWPWLILDYSKFEVPKYVKFESDVSPF